MSEQDAARLENYGTFKPCMLCRELPSLPCRVLTLDSFGSRVTWVAIVSCINAFSCLTTHYILVYNVVLMLKDVSLVVAD